MIIYWDLEQGSPEWLAARCGIPTASMFDKIITPTGKASAQADSYLHTLIAEWVTGKPGGMEPTPWMQRGTEMEPEARGWYEMETDADAALVGFVARDDALAGCSPDAMVGDGGLLEIKCPSPGVHVEYLLSGELPGKYRPQVQGQLYVCERDWCDFVSYSPDMPPVLICVHRDEAYINALAGLLDQFVERMLSKREQVKALGIMPVIDEAA